MDEAVWIHNWSAHEVGQTGESQADCATCGWSARGTPGEVAEQAAQHDDQAREVPFGTPLPWVVEAVIDLRDPATSTQRQQIHAVLTHTSSLIGPVIRWDEPRYARVYLEIGWSARTWEEARTASDESLRRQFENAKLWIGELAIDAVRPLQSA